LSFCVSPYLFHYLFVSILISCICLHIFCLISFLSLPLSNFVFMCFSLYLYIFVSLCPAISLVFCLSNYSLPILSLSVFSLSLYPAFVSLCLHLSSVYDSMCLYLSDVIQVQFLTCFHLVSALFFVTQLPLYRLKTKRAPSLCF
jgi:hypothetical protein